MSKAEDVIHLAESYLGYPYVFGARGQKCTPANRKRFVDPHHPTVESKCQVLNGSAAACTGCPNKGKLMFDCRGFTYFCLKEYGIILNGNGCTSQYKDDSNWEKKGLIKDAPMDKVLCLFKYRDTLMQHTGFWIPWKDKIIDCSNGVEYHKLSSAWTHFGLPAGLYSDNKKEDVNLNGKCEVVSENGKPVNFRTGASLSANKIKSVPQLPVGTEVNVVAADGNWAKVEYTITGYMKTEYLKKV